MKGDLDATTAVRVELRGRRATIEDVQQALNTLTGEGVPESFEIDIHQSEDREYEEGVPFSERKVTHLFWAKAERAAK